MNRNTKIALIIGGIALALLIILPVLGNVFGWNSTGYSWGMMGPGMMGYGWGWFMPVLMVVFWGLVIWGIVALVRSTGCCVPSRPDDKESALDILRKRYAKGEINREEFEAKKKDLT